MHLDRLPERLLPVLPPLLFLVVSDALASGTFPSVMIYVEPLSAISFWIQVFARGVVQNDLLHHGGRDGPSLPVLDATFSSVTACPCLASQTGQQREQM